MKNHFDYAALGMRIRKIRKQQHMTQEKLAEECNLSTAHIGHIERGTRALSIESLITISEVLSVSTDYLLLDISPSPEKSFISLLNSMDSAPEDKRNKLYAVVKILTEHLEEL